MPDETLESRDFSITSTPSGDGQLTITVQGELDLAHAATLKELLASELSSGLTVVLDLSEVTFIDSTGLAAIVTALNHTREGGGELMVTSDLQPQARRLLDLTGVLGLLSFVERNGSA